MLYNRYVFIGYMLFDIDYVCQHIMSFQKKCSLTLYVTQKNVA